MAQVTNVDKSQDCCHMRDERRHVLYCCTERRIRGRAEGEAIHCMSRYSYPDAMRHQRQGTFVVNSTPPDHIRDRARDCARDPVCPRSVRHERRREVEGMRIMIQPEPQPGSPEACADVNGACWSPLNLAPPSTVLRSPSYEIPTASLPAHRASCARVARGPPTLGVF